MRQKRLSAGFSPDPLGELPLWLDLGRGCQVREGTQRKGRKMEGKGKEERGKGQDSIPALLFPISTPY